MQQHQSGLRITDWLLADMEKGADTQTLSAEIFEDCGNLLIVEDYAPLFSEENLFLVEMFDETFNIWHIYSLQMMISAIILVIVRNIEIYFLRKLRLLTKRVRGKI